MFQHALITNTELNWWFISDLRSKDRTALKFTIIQWQQKTCIIQSKVFTKFHVRAIDTIADYHSIVLLIVLESKINKRLVFFLVLPSGVGYLRGLRSDRRIDGQTADITATVLTRVCCTPHTCWRALKTIWFRCHYTWSYNNVVNCLQRPLSPM